MTWPTLLCLHNSILLQRSHTLSDVEKFHLNTLHQVLEVSLQILCLAKQNCTWNYIKLNYIVSFKYFQYHIMPEVKVNVLWLDMNGTMLQLISEYSTDKFRLHNDSRQCSFHRGVIISCFFLHQTTSNPFSVWKSSCVIYLYLYMHKHIVLGHEDTRIMDRLVMLKQWWLAT